MSLQVASAAYILIHYLTMKKKQRKRRWWQTEMFKNRYMYSGSNLLADLKFQDISGHYKNFVRMAATDFEFLLNRIAPSIVKQNAFLRESIPVQERLALTLRFLATGDSYASLQYLFKISKQSISVIVPEVCQAMIKALEENIQVSTNFFIYKKLQF
jgi:hypothetical protein